MRLIRACFGVTQAGRESAVGHKSRLILGFLWLLALSPQLWAQRCKNCDGPPGIDILGVHDFSGRGCVGCHPTRKDLPGTPSAGTGTTNFLWRGVVGPDYSAILSTNVFRTKQTTTEDAEASGVLLCLSCHDGNVTPQNMMAPQSYAQIMGLVNFGRQPIPSLLVEDVINHYAVDHPLGLGATIPVGNGLEFANGIFSVVPGSPYDHFVKNYGWPTLAPAQRSNPYGIDRMGRPYLVCTTCHNQHAMDVFVSRPDNPIASDGGGRYYTTFFFVNGPYNPNIHQVTNPNTTSNVQFCRQCHFRFSNEANNSNNIHTLFY